MSDEPGPVEFCWCPEVLHDAAGRPFPCKAIAEVTGTKPYSSTSGEFYTVTTMCAAGHPCEAMPDEVVLLTD